MVVHGGRFWMVGGSGIMVVMKISDPKIKVMIVNTREEKNYVELQQRRCYGTKKIT